jgi:hypothetical protein
VADPARRADGHRPSRGPRRGRGLERRDIRAFQPPPRAPAAGTRPTAR